MNRREAGRRFERPWMKWALLAAAAYNLVWGLIAIAAPNLLFDWLGAERPRYPELWQCIGMIVGVYGVGYAAAATDPLRHWPVILVGLLGKVFGPIGFVSAVAKGGLPLAFGWTILTNDLIWWIPFAAILWATLKEHATVDTEDIPTGTPLTEIASAQGPTLAEASQHAPVFVALLRHAGCTFHREALADLAAAQPDLASEGVQLAIVHMGTESEALDSPNDALTIADPQLRLYRILDLPRGRLSQLFGPRQFARGATACVLNGHGVGALSGDGFQLGGLALIDQGRVVWKRALASASERPDYVEEATRACRATRESIAS